MTQEESTENRAAKAAEEPAPSDAGYRITELSISNVLRVVALDATPPVDYVEVVGNNGNGKTSTLKAIEGVLVGAKAFPTEIVYRGKREAKITAKLEAIDEVGSDELEAFAVKRWISPKGAMKIELTKPDGTPIPRPQEFLDRLIGKITFDPLEFLRDKAKRVKTMLAITDLEEPLEVLALQRKETFDARTLKKRTLRDKQGALKELQVPKNAPDEPVDTAELMNERKVFEGELEVRRTAETVVEHNQREEGDALKAVQRQEKELEEHKASLEQIQRWIDEGRERLQELQSTYGAACHDSVAARGELLKCRQEADIKRDLSALDGKLAEAGDLNDRFNTAKSYRDKAQEVDDLEGEVEELSESIDDLDAERNKLFEEADYPVENMRFGEDDLTVDGLPFTQLSDALQLRLSMEIAAATNPNVRVILLRRANDLDDQALQTVREFAQEKRFQVWLEKIHASEAPAIVLEEGEAVGGTAVSK